MNYRQGDVFILTSKKIKDFSSAKIVKEKILAKGEVTGHYHLLKSINDCKIEVIENQDGCFIKISDGLAELIHQEHALIKITEGIYEVRLQREYDPLDYARRVAD